MTDTACVWTWRDNRWHLLWRHVGVVPAVVMAAKADAEHRCVRYGEGVPLFNPRWQLAFDDDAVVAAWKGPSSVPTFNRRQSGALA